MQWREQKFKFVFSNKNIGWFKIKMNEEGRVWTVSCNDMQGPFPQPFEGL